MIDHPRITLDPDVLAGRPVIRGTRLSVEFVIGLMDDGWLDVCAFSGRGSWDILWLTFLTLMRQQRRGLRRAVVAVARKLAIVMHRIWAGSTATGPRRRWRSARSGRPCAGSCDA